MKTQKLNILIITGIFPPRIGGPAQYAKETRDQFVRMGHSAKVLTYGHESTLPTGIRHLYFFFRTVFNLRGIDFVFALDTFSVGFPGVIASKIFNKKIIIRTGGDFLWEGYVERTGDLVLLKNFYETRRGNFNLKEKIIFKITKWTLNNANTLVFSTNWQREIFKTAYGLNFDKTKIVENFYGEKIESLEPASKIFLAATRPLKWKNTARLKETFEKARSVDPEIVLDLKGAPYDEFLKKIQRCYAVIVVSLGDISPNMILDSVRANKPFLLTKENGIMDRVEDIGVFANPENTEDIKEKILFLANEENYKKQKEKIESFNFTHSWNEICIEILEIANKTK